jgi:hypothetical protein
MKYIFVASGLFVASLLAIPPSAMAGMFGPNFDERVAAVEAKTEGLNNYHAYLARELAMIASAEKAQHDAADKEFLKLAEQAAAKAGGK